MTNKIVTIFLIVVLFEHTCIAFQKGISAWSRKKHICKSNFDYRCVVPLSAASPHDNDRRTEGKDPLNDLDSISTINELSSRRDMLRRSLISSTLLLSSSSVVCTNKANALDRSSNLGMMPNFLMSSEENDRVKGMPVPSKKLGGLTNKIRSVSKVMDELQRDLMQERWDLVEEYPNQLRSYVPVFTAYTDSAFPTDIPTDKGLRVALRYEVGRYFASLERFRQAVNRKALDEAYIAYSDMSLHFDRYLRVGGLYTFYDDNVSLEPLYKGNENSLVYADPKKDPALVRDLIVLVQGPEKGKTGIVIGIYMDGSDSCAVKLDRNKGIREIRVVPRSWAAKRLGEQDPDDVFIIPRNE